MTADNQHGIDAEEAARGAAAVLGLPDFVFTVTPLEKSRASREVGDALLIANGQGAVVQVKAAAARCRRQRRRLALEAWREGGEAGRWHAPEHPAGEGSGQPAAGDPGQDGGPGPGGRDGFRAGAGHGREHLADDHRGGPPGCGGLGTTDKLLSDNLNKAGLDAAGPPTHDDKGNQLGTIARLEHLVVTKTTADPAEIRDVLRLFRDVRKQRQRPAHGTAEPLTDRTPCSAGSARSSSTSPSAWRPCGGSWRARRRPDVPAGPRTTGWASG